MKELGQGRPDRAPKSQSKTKQPEQSPQSGGIKSPERQPLPSHGEGQGEPVDLNANSANTVDAESPEAGLKDKPPLKKRRSLAFAGPRISDELLRISENKKP